MDAPLALESLEALRRLERLLRLGVGGDEFAELPSLLVPLRLGVLDVGERNVLGHLRRRQGLRQPLAEGERLAEHPGGVLERLLRLDRAVGDDHRHPLVAVLPGDVLDDLPAATIVEVDVEVGHGHTVRVEEALEEESVLERVEIGDAHRVGDHRSGTRATAWPDPDAVVLRPVDEVGDDEEVAGEAHRDDDVELVVRLLAHVVGDAVGVPVFEALLDLLDQPRRLVLAGRARELRHVVRRGVEGDLALLRDLQGVVAGFGHLAEERPHLRRRLEVVAGAGEGEAGPALVVGGFDELRTRLDGEQRLVRLRIGFVGVVEVVRGHERDVHLPGKAEQILGHPLLDREPVVHEFAVVVLGPEDLPVLARRGLRLVVLAQAQSGLDLTRGAAGGGDEALGVVLQEVEVEAGPLRGHGVEGGMRGGLEEVAHARVVLRQQGHVRVEAAAGEVVGLLRFVGAPLHPGLVSPVGAGSDVGFDADDRLDVGLGRL
ncbi:Uncharacterised protein [Mycobacteroides abscessus subsp. abscessus]|nr:Uncharacterised protein [Mycobacteroides abscessus subsp. abscessus]